MTSPDRVERNRPLLLAGFGARRGHYRAGNICCRWQWQRLGWTNDEAYLLDERNGALRERDIRRGAAPRLVRRSLPRRGGRPTRDGERGDQVGHPPGRGEAGRLGGKSRGDHAVRADRG